SPKCSGKASCPLPCTIGLSRAVHSFGLLADPHWHLVLLDGLNERSPILGKARAAKPGPRVQEFRSNSFVEPDALGDFLYIRAEFFAEVSDFVDESDLGSEECIGCVFDEFGGPATGVKDR